MADRSPSPDGEAALPLAALSAYLEEHVAEISGPLTAELIQGGRSNLTYLLTDGASRWVLRRPPLGHVLDTAHDMSREHRLISALHPSVVPVPRPLHLAGDAGTQLLGAPFYVMEHVTGRVLRSAEDLRSVADPAGLAQELMHRLADLHTLDPATVGLDDLGRPEGYLERQLGRWVRQVETSGSQTLPAVERVAAELQEHLPTTQRPALVHGDYRLDNVLVGADGRVTAVLDWEMATRGDPIADVASALVWWDGLTGLDSPVAAQPGEAPGYPGGRGLLDAYVSRSGLDLGEIGWYVGLAYFKLAAIFDGIRVRSEGGLTVGEGFAELGPLVPHLLERASRSLRGELSGSW